MQANITSEVAIEQLKGLIVKKALESYKKLPRKTQCYIELEDMIQEGARIVHKVLTKKYKNKWRPNSSKLSSFIWMKLDCYYKRAAQVLNTQKRFDGFDSYLSELEINGFDVPDEEMENEVSHHVWTAFIQVYNSASEPLRENLRNWFLAMEPCKIHVKGVKFVKARDEFRKLAAKHRLDVQDCRMLMHSTRIRNEVVQRLPEHNFLELL